ncbi:ABC transporter ATP-binding protein [Alicyclobacillus macrosporangiidus]|uniref:Iron complex transport system ATP-binding protein n=1 Tax=Alicyclobacillus macrosporangiidus TaxID=392015 RepID=A0A1I7JL57_9BACL|nr:ABC transporter ATP-binding protein [Alicyclobacillus macrosporangiidus]SFU85900.1 iron complex transport system ATP-binding protein [Alicyclobacillus macrosporangiidus]
MARLRAEQLRITYGGTPVVPDLNLSVPDGKITVLVGPNGSGKSTILKAMARILRPHSGAVILDGKAIHALPTQEVAKQLAILPQQATAPEGMTVSELVAYGRFPHQRRLGLTASDREAIEWAMRITGMEELRDRPVHRLSGGQRQRAWIAMILAQQTDILFLDEPTTFLDVTHQLEVLQLLEKLNREQGRTIVMVLHDLNLASRYAHHLVVIQSGEVVCEGSPHEVITRQTLRDVFGVEADIVFDRRTGTPLCLPYGLAGAQDAAAASR